jgi:hypothetical protein
VLIHFYQPRGTFNRGKLRLISCTILAGCGGDSGSSNSAPPAAVVPAPPPAAPVTATINTGELKPQSGAMFIAASMDLMTTGGVSQTNGVITGGMTSNRLTMIDTPQFSGSYSSTTGYHLADSVNTISFGQAQLSADTTTTNGNGVVVFANIVGSVEDYLAMYQVTTYTSSVKGSGYTTAKYGGIGGWQHTVVSGMARQTRLDYFGFGIPTPIVAMPQTGIVKFTLLVSGNYATDTDLWLLTGGSSDFITVDFGARTITGSVALSGQNFYKNVVGGIGSLPITGKFSGNSFSGSIVNGSLNTSGSVSGQFHLIFVGPNANEIVLTYVANDGTQAAVGAAVGVVDPYAQ